MPSRGVQEDLVYRHFGGLLDRWDFDYLVVMRKVNEDKLIIGEAHSEHVGRDGKRDEGSGDIVLDLSEVEYGCVFACAAWEVACFKLVTYNSTK